jgi:broad specificity phosphatase PhoE
MLARSTVLLIRHAEKPDGGKGLSPMGQARADAYAAYFPSLPLDRTGFDHLFVSTDSSNSERPVLTLTPLAKRLDMIIATPYADADHNASPRSCSDRPTTRARTSSSAGTTARSSSSRNTC